MVLKLSPINFCFVLIVRLRGIVHARTGPANIPHATVESLLKLMAAVSSDFSHV